jgi:dTDP-4-amino-4,6-dideoxygalactose transaminase
VHKYIGVNSRLDTIQAAILDIKLKYLDNYNALRRSAADRYDYLLSGVEELCIPTRAINTTHVFHQYTLIVKNGRRDALKQYLDDAGIPSMVYYPIPLNEQEAFGDIGSVVGPLTVTKHLCESVLSLPMHTELTEEQQLFITDTIKSFFKK